MQYNATVGTRPRHYITVQYNTKIYIEVHESILMLQKDYIKAV
jgi:hypothetical protein